LSYLLFFQRVHAHEFFCPSIAILSFTAAEIAEVLHPSLLPATSSCSRLSKNQATTAISILFHSLLIDYHFVT
jgi:hypothetical protein